MSQHLDKISKVVDSQQMNHHLDNMSNGLASKQMVDKNHKMLHKRHNSRNQLQVPKSYPSVGWVGKLVITSPNVLIQILLVYTSEAAKDAPTSIKSPQGTNKTWEQLMFQLHH